MGLFAESLTKQGHMLADKKISLHIIGDVENLDPTLQTQIKTVEAGCEKNTGLNVLLALNYSGQWDILNATRKLATQVSQGEMLPGDITDETFSAALSTAGFSDPDLLIRTSGEQRISNFMLWQFAYTEFYFSDPLWPEFDEAEFDRALGFFAERKRRFGQTDEQTVEEA